MSNPSRPFVSISRTLPILVIIALGTVALQYFDTLGPWTVYVTSKTAHVSASASSEAADPSGNVLDSFAVTHDAAPLAHETVSNLNDAPTETFPTSATAA